MHRVSPHRSVAQMTVATLAEVRLDGEVSASLAHLGSSS